jgi:hypothetical protein
MHQDERGLNAVGEPGGAIGVYGTEYNRTGASDGIAPALVIEWDTRKWNIRFFFWRLMCPIAHACFSHCSHIHFYFLIL